MDDMMKVVIAPAIHVGGEGGNGNDGWSPVLASVADGARIVSQIVDWAGGEGTKPATGKYIGPAGLVDTASEATDIRGGQGAQGVPGEPGNDGSPGADGTDGRNPEYQFSATHLQYRLVGDTEWIDLLPKSDLTGPAGQDGTDGSAGADGKTIISGSGAPASGTGTDGDYYLDPAAQLIYGPKASGAWPAGVSYKGDTGEQGEKGDKGDTGDTGPAGNPISVQSVSGASTLALSDLNTIMRKTGSLTIAANATVDIPINSTFGIQQSGAGPVSIVPAAGVTLIPPYGISLEPDGSLLLRGEYDSVQGVKSGTDEWSFFGQAPAGAVSNIDPVLIRSTAGAIRFFYNQKYLTDTALEVALIGDSQGTALYADPSMEEQLATRFPNWVITNYCISGQNCRNIDADGTNGYVNTAANITKAVADGNKLIIVVDTSNDSSPNEDGGVVPLAEWQSRLLNIKAVAEAAGALPLFFSTFPRSDAGTDKDNQRNMKDWMAENLGNQVMNCYGTLENPAVADTMRPGYNANSDLIHYNATGIGKALAIAEGRLAYFFFTLPAQVRYYRVYVSSTEAGTYTLHETITDPLQTDLSGLAAGWYKMQAEYLDGTLSPMSRSVEVEEATPTTSAAWNFSNTAAPLTGYNNVVGGGLSASAPNNYNATWPDAATGSSYVLRNLPTDSTTALAKWGANYAGNNSGNNVGEAVDPMRHAWWSQNITWSGSTQNQLRIEGCTPGASYTLTFWCSRLAGSAENGVTVIVLNNVTPGAGNEVNALGNTTPKVFTGVVADASGYITICIARKAGTSTFGFINALKIQSE